MRLQGIVWGKDVLLDDFLPASWRLMMTKYPEAHSVSTGRMRGMSNSALSAVDQRRPSRNDPREWRFSAIKESARLLRVKTVSAQGVLAAKKWRPTHGRETRP
jgi:hypothetical protein